MTASRSTESNPLDYLRSIGPCPCKCKQLGSGSTSKCRPVQEGPTRRTSIGGLSWESVISDDDLMGHSDRFHNHAPTSNIKNSDDLGRQKINNVSPSRQPRRTVQLSVSKNSLHSLQECSSPCQQDDLLSRLECSRQRLLAAMEHSSESRRMCSRKRNLSSLGTPGEDAEATKHRRLLYGATKNLLFVS
eukprot:scaffold3477_cov175-Amphora_coffeaeformis.AAC.4